MSERVLDLNGYTDVPAGKIAFVVTFLEMREAPEKAPRACQGRPEAGALATAGCG
ncbi:hypothetical protein QW131_16930 [Roseibium salinum]|nr:hypothetical protein [Roseibium salinum]